MMKDRFKTLSSAGWAAGIVLILFSVCTAGPLEYFTPADPPNAAYTLEAKLTADGRRITVEGSGTVAFRNTASLPLEVIALDWKITPAHTAEISLKGTPLRLLNAELGLPARTPLYYALPKPLKKNAGIRLDIVYRYGFQSDPEKIALGRMNPRLWWDNLPVRDTYRVKLDVPDGYAAATSGRLNEKTGYYENDSVTTEFTAVLFQKLQTAAVEEEGVLIQAFFTPEGEKCARLCLET